MRKEKYLAQKNNPFERKLLSRKIRRLKPRLKAALKKPKAEIQKCNLIIPRVRLSLKKNLL